MPAHRLITAAAGLAALILGGAWIARVRAEIRGTVELSDVPYAQSTTCRLCHPGRYDTWHQTFHRTTRKVIPTPPARIC